ncbi:MAG: preprotein translocase subunit SecA [Bacteroidota bacterium]|jgi:preprotein translocase subunit SecA
MLKFITKLFGNKSDRDLKDLSPLKDAVLEASAGITGLSNDELRAKTNSFKTYILEQAKSIEDEIAGLRSQAENPETDLQEKEQLFEEIEKLRKDLHTNLQESLNTLLPEAFAVIKETARRFSENSEVEVSASDRDKQLAGKNNYVSIRGEKAFYANTWNAAGNKVTWDMVHYDVQLIGGAVLHQGKIAEMATGEGKTLVATLPVYLNALTGKGVHVVTVNDYLARRDSEWMGPLMEFHGLRVDCIDKHEPNSDARRNAYLADITYGTNNEFGFDYLRDNMARSPEDIVQREHMYAIVDEVDSVLVDDARTPLIISGPAPRGDDQEYFQFKPKIEKLVNAQKNYVNTVLADVRKNMAAADPKKNEELGFMLLRAHRGLPKNKALIKILSEPGMKALLQKTEGFYMQDHGKEMPKVDAELFFVIDERHNTIELTEKGIELMSTSGEDAKLYILPDIGSEMAEAEKSGLSSEEITAKKEAIMRNYSIQSERVHTLNQLLKAYTLFEIDVDYVVMDNKVKIVDEQTGRILDGRRYSDGLHQAIEAKENVKVEAATQTYATVTLQNYFRMYRKLAGMTGTAETEAGEFWDIYKLDVVVIPTNRKIVRDDREDLVYKTKREKYNSVITQIEEETSKGRPVLVGTTSVEISELLSKMLRLRNIKHNVLNAKLHQKEAEIVALAGLPGTVTIATNMAGRGTDIKLGAGVKEAGGLAIIGTERHDSRRVDRQLRGRSGRQGDPGSSQFFVSLEDDLMRLFGSDRIAGLMDRMGLKEGEVIQHSMITKSIERAQKKVEENNFATRKRLLEYDDVMNSQREVIYRRRRHALYGERLESDILAAFYDTADFLVNQFQETKNFEDFSLELIRIFSIESPVDKETFLKSPSEDISQKIFENAISHYHHKNKMLQEVAYPAIKNVYESQAHLYENIIFPITDGVKTMQVIINLKKSYESNGKELVKGFEKNVVLSIIDDAWKEHLREMDELKQSVQNAVYEQKDPLLIYKFESFNLFKDLVHRVNQEMVSFLVRAFVPQEDQSRIREAKAPARNEMKGLQTGRNEVQPEQAPAEKQKVQPVRAEKTVGRNDPCPCGSGKKFKNCHGTNA